MNVLLAFLFQMAAAYRHNAATHRPNRPPVVVLVDQGGTVPNVTPPDRLDIAGSNPTDCADQGGTFDTSTSVCHDIDY